MSDANKDLLDKINHLNAGNDPEPEVQGVAVTKEPQLELTIGQLTKAINSNPNHPVAQAAKKACHTLKPNTKVTMDRIDVQALLENKEVNTKSKVEEFDGEKRNVLSKSLGGAAKTETAAAKQPVLKT